MANELWDTLLKFQREVAVPDMQRIVDAKVDGLRDSMLTSFDGVWKRLETLQTEYHALTASMKRVEDRIAALEARMTAMEKKLDLMPLRSELEALKARLEGLEKRLTAMEHKDSSAELLELRWRISTLEAKVEEQE